MTNRDKAITLYTSAIEFLAAKYQVSEEIIAQALKDRHPKVLRAFVDLVTEGIIAINDQNFLDKKAA